MSKVLVTGAGGFIGSHVVEGLVRAGRTVKALVRYNSTSSRGWLSELGSEVLKHVEVVHGDVRDGDSLRASLRGCGEVVHLAALIGIPYSYSSPSSYVATNISGTLNVLQAVRDLELDRMVHTSTSEVYGTALFAPITEEHPLQAQSPYSATKIAADQLVLSFWRSFSTPVVIIRPFNTYGPRQSLRAVVPTIISQVLLGNSNLELGSLTPTRDLTFVTDTAQAFVAALDSPVALGEVIHLGTGFEISIGDLANLIAELMGTSVEVTADQARLRPAASEVERLVSDPARARQLLGWMPSGTGREGLVHGLNATIDWMRSRQERESATWRGYHV